jgi:hypothetical protein
MRRTHERTLLGWARNHEVFYVNRRPALPRGMMMSALAAKHAQALREGFSEPDRRSGDGRTTTRPPTIP